MICVRAAVADHFDGLCGLVSTELGRNPTSGEVFVFLNRPRSHIKLLHWENGGFVLYYKRLEKERFLYPKQWMDAYL
ncbi:IS66 family insertion sequence element accessory protein TnpB [Dyadobacter sp. CY312]|uniref:IS66 family insertion sequence element accessory protein TnpB n=1 Tax=Dyadobacter sp. CY312 TaxID=2907303 RepID=UPI0038D4830D